MDYNADITIDPDALDVEWLRQPHLMVQYSRASAEAERAVDSCKEAVETLHAELDMEIRANPEKYDLGEKVTEKMIEAAIISDKGYQDATKEFIDAKYEAKMARAAVSALEQKKVALENLVRLFGLQYFAGPKVPRDLSHEWREREEQREVNANVTIRRTRRKD